MLDEFVQESKKPTCEIVLATVAEIGTNGLKLKIDGNDEAGDKEYKKNTSVTFSVGDRVLALKMSGTYVVICAIG